MIHNKGALYSEAQRSNAAKEKSLLEQERLEPKTHWCTGFPCPHRSHQLSADTILNVVRHGHIRNGIAEQHSSKHVEESV